MTVDTTAPVSDKLDFRKLLPVYVIVLIDLLGLTVIIPLLPLYATSFGANAAMIGLLGAAYPVMQFIGAPILGRLSDHYGRKPVLILSQLGTLIGFLILGFANALWLLFVSRLIDGLSGANIATVQAVIADNTNEKNRTQGLGLLGAAFGLGFMIGPVVAFVSLAASGNNYHVPAFVAAALSGLSILLTWFWLDETLPQARRASVRENRRPKVHVSFSVMLKAIRHPQVGLLFVLMFAQQVAFGGFEQLLSLFTLSRLGLNASGNAILFAFAGAIVVAVQGGFIGSWSRKWGDRRLVYLGLATLALGLSFTALTPRQPMPAYSKAALIAELSTRESSATHTIPIELPDETYTGWLGLGWILVALIPAAIGGGILQPSLNSLITKRVEPEEMGGMLGVSAACLSGANTLAPVVCGALFQALGSTAPFLAGGLLLGLLLIVAWQVIKPGREEYAPAGLARSAGAH